MSKEFMIALGYRTRVGRPRRILIPGCIRRPLQHAHGDFVRMARLDRRGNDSRVRVACCGLFVVLLVATAVSHRIRTHREDKRTRSAALAAAEGSRFLHVFATRFTQRKHMTLLDVDLESEGMIFFRSRTWFATRSSRGAVLMMYDGKKVRCYAFSEANESAEQPAPSHRAGLATDWPLIQGTSMPTARCSISACLSEDGVVHPPGASQQGLTEYIQRIEIYVEKTPKTTR